MRISKEERQKTHRKIIEAAVEVISTRGFRDATMHDIAERAQVGDATIYNYFPTKESLLFGFFTLRMDDLIERLKAIPDFHRYSFREQLHLLLETKLELFAADRAFIRIAYTGVFLTNWVASAASAQETKERFIAVVDDLLTAAVEVEEFEEPPFKRFLYDLLWEYTIGVTWYWLEDDSRMYVRTTQMIDKSLAVFDALLRSNVLAKGIELVQFLIREHLLSIINRPPETLGGPRVRTEPKRPFMQSLDTPHKPAAPRNTRQARKHANQGGETE